MKTLGAKGSVALIALLLVSMAAVSASAAQSTFDDLVVLVVPVLGSDNVPEAKSYRQCTPNTRFYRNEKIVWDIKVMDPRTGEYLDGEAVPMVEVHLPNGEVIMPRYSPRPRDEPTDAYWAGGWLIPEDYPSGTFHYTVLVEHRDGRQGRLLSFDAQAHEIVILDAAVTVLE